MSTMSTTSSTQGDPIYRGDYSEFFATADMPPPALSPASPVPFTTITELPDISNLTILTDAATTTKDNNTPSLIHTSSLNSLLEEGELTKNPAEGADELNQLMQIVVDLQGVITGLEAVKHINQILIDAAIVI